MARTGLYFPFVVQEHHEDSATHWDLMLQRPGENPGADADVKNLATWKLSLPPLPENIQRPLSALALPDHRKSYLTYEGPIGNNRGWCKIFDRGQYELIESTSTFTFDFWRVWFHGTLLQGGFMLKKINPPSGWILVKSDETG